MEAILSYLYYMVKKSDEKGKPMTKEYLNTLGKDVNFEEKVRQEYIKYKNNKKLDSW